MSAARGGSTAHARLILGLLTLLLALLLALLLGAQPALGQIKSLRQEQVAPAPQPGLAAPALPVPPAPTQFALVRNTSASALTIEIAGSGVGAPWSPVVVTAGSSATVPLNAFVRIKTRRSDGQETVKTYQLREQGPYFLFWNSGELAWELGAQN
jgi:hypothetical protein